MLFHIPSPVLLFCGDSEGLHFAVEMTALEAEGFGGAGYVAVVFIEFFRMKSRS